jgi:hypothetical protein
VVGTSDYSVEIDNPVEGAARDPFVDGLSRLLLLAIEKSFQWLSGK